MVNTPPLSTCACGCLAPLPPPNRRGGRPREHFRNHRQRCRRAREAAAQREVPVELRRSASRILRGLGRADDGRPSSTASHILHRARPEQS